MKMSQVIKQNNNNLSPSIHLKDQNDNFICEPVKVANIFNNFFVNIGKQTEKLIPKGTTHFSHFLEGKFLESIFLAPTCSSEISTIISQLKANKAVVSNSIPVFLSHYLLLLTTPFPQESFLIN